MTSRRVFFCSIFVILLFANKTFAQCCSMGSPAGASTYVGVLAKNHLRFIAFYRYNFLDTYYEGCKSVKTINSLKNSFFNYSGLTLSYGITKRLTVDADIGYFINKTQIFLINDTVQKARGYGLTNGGVTFKYGAFIKPQKGIELTVGLGFKYPFSFNPLFVNGSKIAIDLQPSTNAFGASAHLIFSKDFPAITMRFMTVNKYEYNFTSNKDYRYGSSITNAIFLSKKVVKNLFAVLQLRNEFRFKDYGNGEFAYNTGGELMILSASISYSILHAWHLAGLFDLPVWKNYNGRQLTPKYSFAFSLTRDFNLNKKSKS